MSPRNTERQHGFTLLEIMIVVAVIAIIAAIAIPNLTASRIAANEAAAISTLRNIMTAQTTIRATPEIDGNDNGIGEYGFFVELSASRGTKEDRNGNGIANRESQRWVSSPVLSTAFGEIDEDGLLRRSGYMFRMALPGPNYQWRWERPFSRRYPRVKAEYAESYWGLYAWPVTYGSSGTRAFFVNQSGQILTCQNQKTFYSGADNKPRGRAAILRGSTNDKMISTMAYNATGRDRNRWTVVQ